MTNAPEVEAEPQTTNELLRVVEAFEANPNLSQLSTLQIALMRAWAEKDPNTNIAKYPTGYIETFRDMAKAALTHLNIEWQEDNRMAYDK